MLANRPEFCDRRPRRDDARRDAVLDLPRSSRPHQIAYIVGDAAAKVAIVEAAFLEPFEAARAQLPALETVIVVEGGAGPATTDWTDVEGADPAFDPEPHWSAVEPDDLLTLIYTSGTTGPAQGRAAHAPQRDGGRPGRRRRSSTSPTARA